jgi:hypothetical protein
VPCVQHVVAGDACCLAMFFPHLADLAVDEVTDQGDYVRWRRIPGALRQRAGDAARPPPGSTATTAGFCMICPQRGALS